MFSQEFLSRVNFTRVSFERECSKVPLRENSQWHKTLDSRTKVRTQLRAGHALTHFFVALRDLVGNLRELMQRAAPGYNFAKTIPACQFGRNSCSMFSAPLQ